MEFNAWAKGEGKYHPSYFLLASAVQVWCVSLSRVWHNVSFLEIVGILDMSLGILNPGAVNIWAVAFSYLFIQQVLFSPIYSLFFLEENMLEYLKVL